MEHLQHFALSQDPFSNEPDLRFYFESASHRDAQRRVERGLRQRKGLTLLTGEGGMGKTLLARRILDSLEEEVFEATLLVMLPGAADAAGVLQRFARQMGVEQPAADRAGLLGQIYEQLAIVREDGRHAVLMIDDAQIMTPAVFSELGGLLNLEYEDRRLLSMLFVGSPELDQLVESDPAIGARIDVRVQLRPLSLENAAAYVAHRLKAVQGSPELIPAGALEALFKFGRGRPRLINTLADNALFEAYLAGRSALESVDVERAAADLGIGGDPGTTYRAGLPTSACATAAAPMTFEEPTGAAIGSDVTELAGAPPTVLELGPDLGPELEPEFEAVPAPPSEPVLASALPVAESSESLALEEEALAWDAATEPGEAQAMGDSGPELELTSVVSEAPPVPDFEEAPVFEADSLDLGVGFDAAKTDAGQPFGVTETVAPQPEDAAQWQLDGLELDLSEEPRVAEAVAEPVALEPPDAAFDPGDLELELPAAELAPEEFSEIDELDDAFVELIEE